MSTGWWTQPASGPAHDVAPRDRLAHRAAAPLRRTDALVGAPGGATRALALGGRHRARPAGGRVVGVAGRQRYCARVPARQLGCAVRHRAGAGPPVGADGAADRRARLRQPAVRGRRRRAAGSALSQPVPVSADGPERRVPHGRPVQSVRVLRGAADRLVWLAAARCGRGAAACLHPLRELQPGRLGALPDRRELALRADRHTQYGRAGPTRGAGRARPSVAGAKRRADAGDGVRRESRTAAVVPVAAGHLWRGERSRGRTVCGDDQGRRLRHPARHHADLRRGGGPGGHGGVTMARTAGAGHAAARCRGCAGGREPANDDRQHGHRLGRHLAAGRGAGAARLGGGRLVLPRQQHAGHRRAVPVGRPPAGGPRRGARQVSAWPRHGTHAAPGRAVLRLRGRGGRPAAAGWFHGQGNAASGRRPDALGWLDRGDRPVQQTVDDGGVRTQREQLVLEACQRRAGHRRAGCTRCGFCSRRVRSPCRTRRDRRTGAE